MPSDVQDKVNELMDGKPVLNTQGSAVVNPAQTPSMIEEARQLKSQLTTLRDEIKAEREKLDHVHAQALLGGKSILGNTVEKTKEEIAAEKAKQILAVYGK